MTPQVVGQEQVYNRYLTVFNRSVNYPGTGVASEGKTFEFDVVGHPRANFHFTCIFPIRFSSGTPQVTILREYCWGPDSILHSLPTGGFDPKKHTSYEECAKDELSEEAHLHGGELVRLLPNGHAGIAESKWCANRFTPFLCIDPEPDQAPGEREAEEFIEVLQVGMEELDDLLYSGNFSQPAFTTASLALRHLRLAIPSASLSLPLSIHC
eukprot:CAMPEP_0117647806 /NCGR_PEP_ID=MMETSP0804-20121206/45_1 /TAXON_ID=1074897 /ORGANISM="Tetraselmis astigmatica, Strain CCMP880" /LENGTH=210 /DNA_ID=CAMNT_0005453321 /DNA_START=359 /DNA_END=991 /DNA_ORIENTATION=+